MDNYYVNMNPQPTGEHEVHKEGCSHPPEVYNRKHLGKFSDCKKAVIEANKYYENVDGCDYCVPECHNK